MRRTDWLAQVKIRDTDQIGVAGMPFLECSIMLIISHAHFSNGSSLHRLAVFASSTTPTT